MKAEKAAAVAVAVGGDEWRCRRHPAARSGGGVCPYCVRDRLLRLCPSCARVRPCRCASTCAASPSSSSSASGDAVGRVHSLIEREHRIARSRSVAASSSAAMASVAAAGVGGRRKARVWGWTPFWRASAKDGCAADEEDGLGLARSSSVSATAVEAKAVAAKAAAAKARWGWHFPSPMKAFRHRRSSASMPERG